MAASHPPSEPATVTATSTSTFPSTPNPHVNAESEWLVGPDSVEFYTKRWSPREGAPRAHMVFAHGIIEHVERYNYFFSLFAERGISVFAFDQRGWGQTGQKSKTQGITSMAKQLLDLEYFAAKELERAQGRKVFVCGHSMGGGIVLNYACQPDASRPTLQKLGGIIASAPMILQPPGYRTGALTLAAGGLVGRLLPSLQLKIPISGETLSHDDAVNKAYVVDPLCSPIASYKGVSDMFHYGKQLQKESYKNYPASIPLLIYHGDEDALTWHDAAKEFVDRVTCTDKTFISYPGGYHELHNEPDGVKEKVAEDVTQWILTRS